MNEWKCAPKSATPVMTRAAVERMPRLGEVQAALLYEIMLAAAPQVEGGLLKALESIRDTPLPKERREPDDADWRFHALDLQRVAANALAALASQG